MRKFLPGQSVRIERNARIVGQVKDNPYWYIVELPDGTQEQVNIGRLSAVADEARATIDLDGSVLVLTNRLSLDGAKSLLDWLACHIETFDDEAYEQARAYAPDGSTYHDYLCCCPGCNPQPSDGQ